MKPGRFSQNWPRVALHIANSFRAGWSEVIRPWFELAAQSAAKQTAWTAVVTPFRSNGYALKQLLLDYGLSVMGIRFVSPNELRALLAERTGTRVPLREHLRLLLSIAAEECMTLPEDAGLSEKRILEADYLTAKSVRRAPDHLLRTIQRLGAAGWSLAATEIPALREIATRFQRRVDDTGFELIHAADRRALDVLAEKPGLFCNLLVVGFNGAHWPLWPLLQAAVGSANAATVMLEDPRDEARDIDQTWVGTWEEAFGEALPISSGVRHLTDTLFSEDEMRGASPAPAKRSFLVGGDNQEESEAVVKQCVHFLADPACDRIGIIFSSAGALPRLVANALAREGIPHHDGLGHFIPGVLEAPEWRAWLQFQQTPRVNSLLKLVNVLPRPIDMLGELDPTAFDRTLRAAYAEVLVDDLDVLQLFCAQKSGETERLVAVILHSIVFLPAQARLAQFLDLTKTAFAQLGWKTHWLEISRTIDDWTDKLEVEFSRTVYLRWLNEIASTFTASREPVGDHPYARVHLLTVPQADGQEWSHLIFAGWNEASWPPPDSGEFVREDEIDAFNRSIRKLNRQATRQGRQGEGHTAIRENHTLYLGPYEQRQIACRQFERLLESASQRVTFTASLVQEEAPERLWNPSELLTRCYQEARNRPLTQRTMLQLQAQTRSWLAEPDGATRKQTIPHTGNENTRLAYDARRDPNVRSGRFDFAFPSKPPFIPTLSVSDFEQLLSSPALVWLKKYLGVKATEENANVWNTSTGKWVHDWLAAIAIGTERTFTRFPEATEIDQRICAAAEEKRSEVAELCQAAGKSLPDWWTSGWRNAVFLARILGDKLATIEGWPWIATEWTVSDDQTVQVAQNAALILRGRIDVLLAQNEPASGSLQTDEVWIVDYKTGAKKALIAARQDAEGRRPALRKKLLDGSALQLGLYALAANGLGAGQVAVSLLSPLVRPVTPQMSSTDFGSETEIFVELARMQQTGIFGMHGPLRSAFRFTDDYPLATLAIDPDVLEQRWELTHPALVRDEEDLFW